ncbi:hypothetical protein [Nocardia salmonicida]|uniref:hypothetical protein n=1 Tax=Nocardia salmonicida TaxID=53431 RepID=UPI003CEFBAE6
MQSAQTGIGEDVAPEPGSLRFYRGIRPDMVLVAPLRWARPPDTEHIKLMARTVLALDQIGEGRSDNLGRVGLCPRR